MKLGYLGPIGTHTQRAAEKYKSRVAGRNPAATPYTTIPASSIPALFNALRTKSVESIMIPLENSHEGVVQASMDLLVSSDCYIQEEIVLEIRQDLVAQKGVEITAITDIISHPQAIAQCSHFLQKSFPDARIHVAESTAAAAQRILDQENATWAAIGSPALTDAYPLQSLATNIQDSENNQTRFVVVSNHIADKTGQDKTSIVFSIKKDQPGGLYDILESFATRHINLTHIASRPSKTMLGEYRFFVDCEGHIGDTTVASALSIIKAKCAMFKLLGSYRKDMVL